MKRKMGKQCRNIRSKFTVCRENKLKEPIFLKVTALGQLYSLFLAFLCGLSTIVFYSFIYRKYDFIESIYISLNSSAYSMILIFFCILSSSSMIFFKDRDKKRSMIFISFLYLLILMVFYISAYGKEGVSLSHSGVTFVQDGTIKFDMYLEILMKRISFLTFYLFFYYRSY